MLSRIARTTTFSRGFNTRATGAVANRRFTTTGKESQSHTSSAVVVGKCSESSSGLAVALAQGVVLGLAILGCVWMIADYDRPSDKIRRFLASLDAPKKAAGEKPEMPVA